MVVQSSFIIQSSKTVSAQLQNTLTGVIFGVQQLIIDATINEQNSFYKLGDRMLEDREEEMKIAGKIIQQVLDLSGTPELKSEKWSELTNFR